MSQAVVIGIVLHSSKCYATVSFSIRPVKLFGAHQQMTNTHFFPLPSSLHPPPEMREHIQTQTPRWKTNHITDPQTQLGRDHPLCRRENRRPNIRPNPTGLRRRSLLRLAPY